MYLSWGPSKMVMQILNKDDHAVSLCISSQHIINVVWFYLGPMNYLGPGTRNHTSPSKDYKVLFFVNNTPVSLLPWWWGSNVNKTTPVGTTRQAPKVWVKSLAGKTFLRITRGQHGARTWHLSLGRWRWLRPQWQLWYVVVVASWIWKKENGLKRSILVKTQEE